MKIAFYLENGRIKDIDFSTPQNGNPGSGAAPYLHVAIPYYLKTHDKRCHEAYILAQNNQNLPESIPSFQVEDEVAAARKAKELGVDIFVYWPHQNEVDNIISVIDELELPSVGRAALTPTPQHIRKMANSRYFKALVCVGREQYDFLQDTALSSKIYLIENGVFFDSFQPPAPVKKDPSLVVYLGALKPQKGFHLLAQAWPKVIAAVPRAKLAVIGSSRVYDSKATLGEWGIADRDYEDRYLKPYISDEQGNIHASVTFLGQLGQEKNHWLQKASIGIANPSGKTETSCVSAIEFQCCQTPVVTGAYYALLDTVVDNETGLLGKTVDDLANNIITLLQDNALCTKLGKQAQNYARGKYDFSIVGKKWMSLFLHIKNNETWPFIYSLRYWNKNYKILRIVNRPLQQSIGHYIWWPSVEEAKRVVVEKIRSFISFFKKK